MKRILHNFEISCDRCGKTHKCINVTDDYLPPDWKYEAIKKSQGSPIGISPMSHSATGAVSAGATGSINYGCGGSFTISSGNFDSLYVGQPSMEYLCPDCYNIKDILE